MKKNGFFLQICHKSSKKLFGKDFRCSNDQELSGFTVYPEVLGAEIGKTEEKKSGRKVKKQKF